MTNICILMRGRLRLSRQALESLYANTPEKDFICTVVSDSEEDFRVTRLLHSYLDHKNFALLEVSNSGHVLAQLKNLAVGWSSQRFGRGDWLYISDGDVYFCPGWLEKLTEIASQTEREDFRLWGGQIHPFHQPLKPVNEQQFVWRAVDGKMTEHAILDGPSWLMRWKTWNEYGPFSRRNEPGPCRSEEYPFCQRLTAPINGGSYRDAESRNGQPWGGGRIGVISPHCVIHTGLTQTDGKDAPGRKEREAMIPEGVIAE